MSIIKINPDDIERYTLLANPSRTFSSSSNSVISVVAAGITGSLPLFSDGTSLMKDVAKGSSNTSSDPVSDDTLESERAALLKKAQDAVEGQKATGVPMSFLDGAESYLKKLNDAPSSTAFDKKQNVTRFMPGVNFDKTFRKKSAIKEVLYPYYRSKYPTMQWSYTNYHSLNFVTCSLLPTGTALIYPAATGSVDTVLAKGARATNYYAPSGSFTFDFYINPRYSQENISDEMGPGTIFHMSSSYAISLVTGSSVGIDGKADGYRILLQLSQSAEIPPREILVSDDEISSNYPGDQGFLFLSPDNSLKRNTWHHVAIRWGGADVQNGTGSFVIDGKERSTFVITSASVMEPVKNTLLSNGNFTRDPLGRCDADALFIGNFYEGSNTAGLGTAIAGFFNPIASLQDGCIEIEKNPGNKMSSVGTIITDAKDPVIGSNNLKVTDGRLRHPLNAEVHDLKIFNRYRSNDQIYSSSIGGFSFNPFAIRSGVLSGSDPYLSGTSAEEGLLFYVPPFFTKVSPDRQVNKTPFTQGLIGPNYPMAETTTPIGTQDPFNVEMSFIVDGHELNLQNFTREFVRGFYPRPFGLGTDHTQTEYEFVSPDDYMFPKTANEYLYRIGANRKRNITVLPCDNGKFFPNFLMLMTGSLVDGENEQFNTTTKIDLLDPNQIDKFKTAFGNIDFSIISLENLLDDSALSVPAGNLGGDASLPKNHYILARPENPGLIPQVNNFPVAARTKDKSSNEVVFFDVSNVFYGDRLKPKSVMIKDLAVTGTSGRVQITLRDDGLGNLYRSDSESTYAKWASVGNVIYEEGIIVIKSPNIPLFGSDAWELSFEGEKNIHVLEINVLADKGLINSSSNPTFKKLIPTDNANENATEFVYLTGLQLHDDNLNVIGRANLAQPVVKRDTDRYTIRLRMDF